MRNILLAAGVAAMAISSPSLAQGQGKGQGKGNSAKMERGGGKPDKANGGKGGGKDKAQARGNGNANRGGGNDRVMAQGNPGRGNDKIKVNTKGNRGNDRVVVRENRGPGNSGKVRVADANRGPNFYRYGQARGLVDGCPPGLAKKNYLCMPPGHAKNLIGTQASRSLLGAVLGGPYSSWYRDDDYRYRMGDDYIYRIGMNGLIDGLIPLYDRPGYYYPVGSRYPEPYNFYNVPYQYRSYYDDPYYRYGDGAIYRINPETRLIQSIAALLTGDAIVGQPLPASYGVYNMPYSYRDRYYDTNDNWYRYSDGYVYRVEPETLIVAEVLDAII